MKALFMPNGYVTLKTFPTPIDAELCRVNLESEGIPVCILDENTGGLNAVFGMSLGVRLQVPEASLAAAHEILRAAPDAGLEPNLIAPEQFDGLDDDDDEGEPLFEQHQDVCPFCASVKIRRFNTVWSQLRWAVISLLLMVLFRKVPLHYSWYCDSCFQFWRGP